MRFLVIWDPGLAPDVAAALFTPRSQMGSCRLSSSAADSRRRTAKSSVTLRSSRSTRPSSTMDYRLAVTLAANSR